MGVDGRQRLDDIVGSRGVVSAAATAGGERCQAGGEQGGGKKFQDDIPQRFESRSGDQ